MKKKIIIYIFLLIIPLGILFAYLMYHNSLSGLGISLELQEISFKELGMNLNVPDDWVLFNASGNDEFDNEYTKYLIVSGSNPAGTFPRVEIYDFEDQFSDIKHVLYWDALRVENQFEEKLYQTTSQGSNSSVMAVFGYQEEEILFILDSLRINCKDWIEQKNEKIFLISICATKQQWDQLDKIYYQIVNSIEFY